MTHFGDIKPNSHRALTLRGTDIWPGRRRSMVTAQRGHMSSRDEGRAERLSPNLLHPASIPSLRAAHGLVRPSAAQAGASDRRVLRTDQDAAKVTPLAASRSSRPARGGDERRTSLPRRARPPAAAAAAAAARCQSVFRPGLGSWAV